MSEGSESYEFVVSGKDGVNGPGCREGRSEARVSAVLGAGGVVAGSLFVERLGGWLTATERLDWAW